MTSSSQRVHRSGRRALVAGAALFLAMAAPAVAWAAPSQATAGHTAAAPRAATAITCSELDQDLPNVFGRDCDSREWGPIADFTIADRSTGNKFQCRTGWAEGSLWVSGQDCVPVNG
ncbi:hypothetical protein ACFYWO_18630 [Streptomyces sp. NPDC002932]|uniref:hypothetical protein n=1 Tax=Streptomyces sp. NPDC002932 TaxID=3364672 RepID=UPI0036C29F0E